MPAAAIIPAVASVGMGLISADKQRSAANKAADAQRDAANQAAAQQQQAFDTAQQNLAPYRALGQQGITGVQGLLGLNGADAQQQAINAIQASPQFQAMTQQGENALRQNAAATGGLRGGNFQAALAQFRPQLLGQLIDQRYGQLAGLLNSGLNASAGVGQAAMQTGQSLGNLSQAQGAYQAGAGLAGARANVGLLRDVGGLIGQNQAPISNFISGLGSPFGGGSWAQPQSSATQSALFGNLGYGS